MSAAPDEFEVIAELFAPLARAFPGALGLTDDAALLPPDADCETVVTMDAMVAGVHFLPDDPADLVARKLVRVNLSDLAAKGARPFAVLLAAAFPHETGLDWLRLFAEGLRQDMEHYGIALIGGDTVATPGPLTLSLTALGKVPAGRAILRSGAAPGDTVWVSGRIGDGALGLKAAQGALDLAPRHVAALAESYRLPQPRVTLGPRLVGIASAGMDVSDGLVQDLGHLCRASGVAAEIEAAKVPLSEAAAAAVQTTGAVGQSRLASVLTGGDDYELLFTAPAIAREAVLEAGRQSGVAVSAIGAVAAGQGVSVRDADGRELCFSQGGWRHFRATETGGGA